VASNVQRAKQITVYLGPADGSAVNPFTDRFDALRPIEISVSAGGRRLDHAVFEYDLGATGERLVELLTPAGFSRRIQVRYTPDSGPDALLFWGDLTVQDLRIDQTERLAIIARVEPYHFGDVLRGIDVWDPVADAVRTIHDDITFNPLIDGRIEGNRSDRFVTVSAADYFLWIDPESVRTTPAQTVQDGNTANLWSIDQAVQSLSVVMNDETFVTNNVETAGIVDPMFSTGPDVKNVALRRGSYLPDYLDALLTPLGFGWYLDYRLIPSLAPADARVLIVIYKQGVGPEKTVKLQPPGSVLDLNQTNLAATRITTNIADAANSVEAYGSLEQREITVELYRGWPESQDDLNLDDLDRTNPDGKFADNQNAWRLWVANEAGDYSGTRTVSAIIPSSALDLSPVFSRAIPRRRRFDRPLTRDENGRRRPILIEWYDAEQEKWQAVPPQWGAAVLKDQMGIYFSGDTPPAELMQHGVTARIRVTGTVTGDTRLTGVAVRQSSAPNAREVVEYLDVSDRYHDRSVFSGGAWVLTDNAGNHGPFTSILDGDANGADTQDDAGAIDDLVTKLRTLEQPAAMDVTFVLHGLFFTEYAIGDLLTTIDGRFISLDRNSVEAGSPRYPQITGIRWNFPKQTTELIVDTTVGTDPDLIADAAQRRGG